MKNFWTKIPLLTRLLLMLGIGITLLLAQLYYYHFLLLLGGMAMILISFFSLKDAPARDYTPEDRKALFIIPVIIGSVAGVAGFILVKNISATVAIIIMSVGLYSFIIRKIVLNLNGYKVYENIYAIIPAFILSGLGAFVLIMVMQVEKPVMFEKPSGHWEGTYQLPGNDAGNCDVNNVIHVNNWQDESRLVYGQYEVKITSDVNCQADTVVGVPLYDDITAYGAERDGQLIIWEGADKDTILILTRQHDQVLFKTFDKRIEADSLKIN
jgi:hypothetical protein